LSRRHHLYFDKEDRPGERARLPVGRPVSETLPVQRWFVIEPLAEV
jgi:hypothetical protein